MTLRVTWSQALAWRMDRHFLGTTGGSSVTDVVSRLCGVQAQVASSAEFAIRVRQSKSKAGEVAAALSAGRLIKTWAMRGTLHLLTPNEAGGFLSLLAATKTWERPIWVRYFGVTPAQMEKLRTVVPEILGDGALTREELITEVTRHEGFAHLGKALRSGWGTLLKPLAWQGDICFGPAKGTRVTFMRPTAASRKWAGVPSVDDAWRGVILAYLGAYGPATPDRFSRWLSFGAVPMRTLKGWFDELGDAVAQVEVDAKPMYVRSVDVGDLSKAQPSRQVRLLGGFDQWVLGPGTDDTNVVPAARRRAVSKTAGWIAPVVVNGGVVSGTWKLDRDTAEIAWFAEAGSPPRKALAAEVAQVSSIFGRELTAKIEIASR